MLDVGLPLALQEYLTQVSFLALCAFVNRLGLEASSGYGGACKIVNFAMLIPCALMQSMASFVSQNIGAGKEKRARQAMFTGIGVGLACGCLVFILVLLKGDVLAGCFSTDAAVVQKGFDYLKGFAPGQFRNGLLDQVLVFRVHAGGGLVQDDDGASFKMARAMEMRCFSPPERPSPTTVSYPLGRAMMKS